jgi:hypothetical protein
MASRVVKSASLIKGEDGLSACAREIEVSDPMSPPLFAPLFAPLLAPLFAPLFAPLLAPLLAPLFAPYLGMIPPQVPCFHSAEGLLVLARE